MNKEAKFFQQLVWIGPFNFSLTSLGRQFTFLGYGFSVGSAGIRILMGSSSTKHIYKTKFYKEYEAWKASNPDEL